MNMPHLRLADTLPHFEDITFRADRAKLHGRLFHPGGTPKAAIVIHAATGVPQTYYRDFATWLADQGYACLTYDYRDFGESSIGPVKQSKATMADWGSKDQPAAQRFLEGQLPGVPIWVIGHSLGGLMLPFQDGAGRLARVITVASGPVHLRDHPWRYRWKAFAFWYGPGALATAVLGYLPGRALGLGRDLPKGVYWQWRRWCNSAGFALSDMGQALPVPDIKAVTAPLKIVAIADDDMAPPAACWRIMSFYPEAPKRQLTLKPEQFGLDEIGHMGAFKVKNAVLWSKIMEAT